MGAASGTMKISFAVSATPKVELLQNEGYYVAQTVIHEDVRTSVGGSGEVTAGDLSVNSQWADGDSTAVTSNNGVASTIDSSTDLVMIKHTGFTFADQTVASEVADTVLVKSGSNVIAELKNGEAIVLPRPQSDIDIASGPTAVHVAVEVTILGGE